MSPAVQEIDRHVQQLSLTDQLWLLEKLVQHIREQISMAIPIENDQKGNSDNE